MKRRLFSVMVACMVFAFASAQVKFYVKNSGSNSNNGSESNPFKTIEYAITKVQSNTPTIIYLEKGATFNYEGVEPAIGHYAYLDFQNDKKVELIGDNTTLLGWSAPGNKGGKSWRILRGGAGCEIKITGVNFENGRITEYMLGGAIYFAGNKLELENCKFLYNEAGSAGAAIGSRGNQLIINNCYFEGNYTIGGGAIGATIMHCGPKLSQASKDVFLKISNSTFYKNNMEAGTSRGAAVGIYDQSTGGGKYSPSIGRLEIVNSTFFENTILDGAYEAVIDLTNGDELDVFLVNNTFHNNLGAISIPFILGEITFINNVVYANKTTLLSSVNAGDRMFHAYNNVLIGGERGVNEKMTEPSLNDEKSTYNNIVETTLTYPLSNLGLASSLSTDLAVPYLPILEGGSPLVNAGMDDTSAITGANLVLPTDIRGYANSGRKDIGAYEYGAKPDPVGIAANSADASKFYEIAYTQDGVIVKNASDKKLTLRVVGIDGKQIYSAGFEDELNLSKGELQKGIVVFILTNGVNTQAEKVFLN